MRPIHDRHEGICPCGCSMPRLTTEGLVELEVSALVYNETRESTEGRAP